MRKLQPLDYLTGYPPPLVLQIGQLLEQGKIGDMLARKYPRPHTVRTDRALHDYVQELKAEHMRSAAPLAKVAYDGSLQTLKNALGTHTTVSRVQGGRLKAKREIRIATLFRAAPAEFLRMIVVHELAHMKEREHDKAFYQLCLHMEPGYHQIEFDLRTYLSHLQAGGEALWDAS